MAATGFVKRALHKSLRSRIVHNAASLYLIQFANLFLPLITVPYLVRILGPAGYGEVAFAQGLVAYFLILVDYGFSMSTTRDVSVAREDPMKVSRIVSAAWAAQTVLALLGLILMLFMCALIAKIRAVTLLLLIIYGTVIGNVLYPTWLFQGMERMVPSSVINFAIRIVTTICIFFVIRKPQDYIAYAALMSIGSLAAGVAATVFAFRHFDLRFIMPSPAEVWKTLADGWTLFISRASISLYAAGNAFILGMLTNATAVGYYSAAERLVKAVLGLINPVVQAAYPRFSKMVSDSREKAMIWGRKMLIWMTWFCLGLSLTLFLGAHILVKILLGAKFGSAVPVIQVLATLPLSIGISNVLGLQIMLPFNKDRAFCAILIAAGILNILLALLLAPRWQAVGMAVAVAMSEILVVVAMFLYLWRCRLNPLARDWNIAQRDGASPGAIPQGD